MNNQWQVFDWAGNDVNSPVFDSFDDASEWIDAVIGQVYGDDLSDDEYNSQRDEYVIERV